MGCTKRTRRVPGFVPAGTAVLASLVGGLPAAGEASAHAAESRQDVETDHFDGADGRGPRTWGLAIRPVELSLGRVGFELGVAAASNVVLTLEADWLALAPTDAYGAIVGAALFPLRVAFHGFYVHPRLEWWRAPVGAASREAAGVGALVGYAWITPVGASLRLGGGLAYCTPGAPPSSRPAVSVVGLLPELDLAIGWVF